MKFNILNLLSITLVSFLMSCAGSEPTDVIVEDTAVEVEVEVAEAPIDDIFYQVPSPNDLFNVLKDADISYNKEILNDLSRVESLNSKKAKALNFGVYAAVILLETTILPLTYFITWFLLMLIISPKDL